MSARRRPDRTPLALRDAPLIGRGSGRSCYEHPDEPGLCVKVPYNDRGRRECGREHGYLRRVARLYGDDVHAHVARLHGAVPTDLGTGWLVERVRDEGSGASSALLVDALTRESFESAPDGWRAAWDELLAWAARSAIVIRDWSATNVCARRLAGGGWKLIVIDGIGPKEAVPLWLPLRAHARYRNRYYAARAGLDSVESLLALCERERERPQPSSRTGVPL